MNPRAFDLITRSITTAVLALGVLAAVAYEAVHKGEVDATLGAAFGLIVGVYFGAHVAQNGASARSRAETLAVANAIGEVPPLDPLMPVRVPREP